MHLKQAVQSKANFRLVIGHLLAERQQAGYPRLWRVQLPHSIRVANDQLQLLDQLPVLVFKGVKPIELQLWPVLVEERLAEHHDAVIRLLEAAVDLLAQAVARFQDELVIPKLVPIGAQRDRELASGEVSST
jgi:hypothetical protein